MRWLGGIRIGLRSFSGAAVLIAGLCLAGTAAQAGSIYGLAVGIDDYGHSGGNLGGAVADAADIAAVLHEAHAGVVVLLTNDHADKLSVTAAWAGLAQRARRGDTLVFSFAGKGDREQGQDGYLLAGFAFGAESSEERLSKQEIMAWFKPLNARGVNAVFVGDASFGGALARPLPKGQIALRQLPAAKNARVPASGAPPEGAAGLNENDFGYALFAYGAEEQGAVPETLIGGRSRGALSYAFARGLEGHADADGDGEVSDVELVRYLGVVVPALTEGQQTPVVIPHRAGTHALIEVAPEISGRVAGLGGDQRLQLAVTGGDVALAGAMPRTVIAVASPKAADMVWHTETGRLSSHLGGVVTPKANAEQMGALLAEWAGLQWLECEAAMSPAPVTLFSGNQLYQPGALVQIEMLPGRYPYLTLFDLLPDGGVVLLSPTDSESAHKDWRTGHLHQMFEAGTEPGAMHRIAILSAQPLTSLQQALAAMQRRKSARGLLAALQQALPVGTQAQFGIFPVYLGKTLQKSDN